VSSPSADVRRLAAHGLSGDEIGQIHEILKREPTPAELAIVSALWSERSSRKSSKVHLQELPTTGAHVLRDPAERAGMIDIGHDWVAVFKMEGRVGAGDPYQEASSAVGGLLSGIFATGARPIACLDALFFGAPDRSGRGQEVAAVVRGLGDYANRVGVPTIGGAARFHPSFDGNSLIHVFALGLARRERLCHARASGSGNPLYYVGGRTGRDGLRDPGSDPSAPPPAAVGDPFTGKALLEACLQVLRTDAVVAIRSLGAQGLAGVFEMVGRAGRPDPGLRLELDRVPLRQQDLAAHEILLSESRERLAIVAQAGRRREVARACERWGLAAIEVGEVTGDGMARVAIDGREVAALPVAPLLRGMPMYRRQVAVPKDLAGRQSAPEVPPPDDPGSALKGLLDTPELGSKAWIWRRYDHTVRTNTVLGPGSDAAVLLLKGTPSGLALSSDVNPVYCALDPYSGGVQAVAAAVRNLACVGAEPVGLADCLSFGDSEDPETSWQFRECVRGMAAACRALDVPAVASDVSFCRGTGRTAIHPAPTVSMVGMIPDLINLPVSHFTTEGDRILLLGRDGGEFGGSAYLRLLHGIEQGRPPKPDLGAEERLADLLRLVAFEGWIRTAHDLAEGGLAVALAEACLGVGQGAEIEVEDPPSALFSETQARALVAVSPRHVDRVLEEAERSGVPAAEAGRVGGSRLKVACDGGTLDVEVEELHKIWSTALPRALGL
jgi:phosphoribosylformylglycinamidine synthase